MRPFILATGFALGLPQVAAAGLELCNATDVTQSIAIGYKSGDIWVSEGWWNAEPGTCVQPVSGNLKNRYYYLLALAEGHDFQSENYSFCIQSEEFTIEGDEDCEGRGYIKRQFLEIDTGETATHFTKAITNRMSPVSETEPASQKQGDSSGKGGLGSAQDEAQADPAPVAGGVTIEDGVIRTGMAPIDGAEPFAKIGHFQTCETMDGQLTCSFHAEGWKFFAYEGGPTPTAMLEALAGLDTGTPIEVTGDILYYGDITAEVAVREVRPMPGSDPYGAMLANLQGAWVSLDDPASGLTITGLEMEETLGEEGYGVRFLQLADTCDIANGAGPVLVRTNPEDQEPQCYMVARADGQNLDLIYFASGNTLRFTRP